jgi:protein ImuA
MSAPSPAVLQALRQQLAAPLARRPVLPFGDARIDRHLPGGGLPIGQLHEIGAEGIEAETGAVAGGFAAVLAGALARHDAQQRVVLWIAPCCDLYAPGLLPYGLDPGRLIVVQTRTDAETLQAMETALRSGAASVVLGETGKLTRLAARRLQLASLQHHTTSLLLRRWPHGRTATQADALAAVTRWHVGHGKEGQGRCPWTPSRESMLRTTGASAPSGVQGRSPWPSFPSWRVDLLHARGGRGGTWIMEVADAPDPLRVVAVLGDHAPAPHLRRAAG